MFPRSCSALKWIAAGATLAALAGCCAGLRCPGCPRIDPTGERLFIWPKDQIRTPVAAVPAVAGNPTAAPVVTDPVFPQPPVAASPPAAPAPGVVAAPMVTPASALVGQSPQEKITMTPERILAPVNSEVVLKAAICGTEGYTLADEKVEWMLGRNGVGQFVDVGGKGLFHPPLIPFAKGTKIDNYLAHGYTATSPLCISRGTADPSDDVNINRGDAWVSVTSPNEGVSHVTAFAPSVASWDLRRSSSVIYWVDVQWTFPPASLSSSGRAETLTTLVTRQTDGTPLEGWTVRYTVADGGQPSDVRTGPDGRASIQVTPTASGAPSSRIDMQLIRPANFAGVDAPQLNIASGSTTINWSGGTPYLPPTTGQPEATSPLTPAPSQPLPQTPITPQNPGQQTPQPQLPAASSARLEVEIQGPQQSRVGENAQFTITIRNTGDQPATGVKLRNRFDPGLIYPPEPQRGEIGYEVGTIGPRETRTIPPLTFQVSKAGSLCQDVTVEYAEGPAVPRRLCTTVAEAAPQREARLELRMDGDKSSVVGAVTTFHIFVHNTGQTPLTNIQIEEEYPPAVFTPELDPGLETVSGKIIRRIDRLDVGQQRTFDTRCRCRQAILSVTAMARATADTDPPGQRIPVADEHTMEIVGAQGQAPPPTGQTPPGATAGPLSVVMTLVSPSVIVNSRSNAMVTVTNKSNADQHQVVLQLLYPANVRLDAASAEGPPGAQASATGDRLVFSAVPVLHPTETVTYRIPINAVQVGRIDLWAQAVSQEVPQSVSQKQQLEITTGRTY
jgi:uncharacterized repeat protein (TIGR01451 family)